MVTGLQLITCHINGEKCKELGGYYENRVHAGLSSFCTVNTLLLCYHGDL